MTTTAEQPVAFDMDAIDNTLATTTEERDGTPVEVGGTTFNIRPLDESNRAFMLYIARSSEDDTRSLKQRMIEDQPDILADVIVVNWDLTVNHEPVDFDPDMARALFTLHPRIANALFEKANELGEEKAQQTQKEIDQLEK